jgi:two-component system, NarL family, sensor kinase
MTEQTRALAERIEQLATLNAIGEVLNEEPSFARAAERALERLVGLLALDAGWLFVTRVAHGDSKDGGFTVAASCGLPPALARDDAAPLRAQWCDCQALFRRGRLDTGVNIVHCSRIAEAEGDTGGLEIHASIPLLGQRGPIGIMNLAAPGNARFDEPTLAFLTAVGRQLGTAFERSSLQDARTREARYLAALEERQRLATEMHDSVAQMLFAADLNLQAALHDPPHREERLGAASALVGEALGRLRALVEVVRPAAAGASLETLLRRLAERLGGALDVQLEYAAPDPDAEVADALYRIAQEASHNALKHADARRLWIRLTAERDALRLVVADDGVGMGAEAEGGGAGIGIASMRHRAARVHGALSVHPRSGGGTEVEVTLPWPAS